MPDDAVTVPRPASVDEIMRRLAEPFSGDDIQWRVGHVSQSGESATLLAYLDARAVMRRLDDVLGPTNWRDSYREVSGGKGGGQLCRLELRINGEWIGKEDMAQNTDIEPVKGGCSDAFKRAAVKWNIGRYLYDLDAEWHDVREGKNPRGTIRVTQNRKYIGWIPKPALPTWALPRGTDEKRQPPSTSPKGVERDHEADVVNVAVEIRDAKDPKRVKEILDSSDWLRPGDLRAVTIYARHLWGERTGAHVPFRDESEEKDQDYVLNLLYAAGEENGHGNQGVAGDQA